MKNQLLLSFLLTSLFSLSCMASFSREPNRQYFREAKNYEGSSELVDLRYHMGPVLANPISLYVIWYGHWNPTHQSTIRDFINSLSPHDHHDDRDPFPSVADWWRTVRLYADQTGSNVTGSIVLSGEFEDLSYSHGDYLSRLAIQYVINNAVTASNPRAALPLNPRNGLYLVLTSPDVRVQDFCRAVCGFHYFTFPTIAGVTVPYAWVGHSGKQCPGLCAYPFAWPDYSKMPPPGGGGIGGGGGAMRPPSGDAGTDGMISVLAHELAEVCSNPLVNAWYAGEDPTAPTEIADLCVGVYGSGGGGGYVGRVYRGKWGIGYNLNGVRGRKFLVQWVWDPVRRRCFGPNAID